MKLQNICSACVTAQIKAHPNTIQIEKESVNLCDGIYYEYICSEGHRNSFFLMNPKHEILFDMGMSAYFDGYYREAVNDFAACLERFHEYCIIVLIFQKHKNVAEEYEKLWKQIQKQSERQYGAFFALYTYLMGKTPRTQSVKMIEFRNDVVHKGYIPSKEKAFEYAQYVANYIYDIYHQLPTTEDKFDVHGWKTCLMAILHSEVSPLIKERGGFSASGMHIHTALHQFLTGSSFDDVVKRFPKVFDVYYSK